MEHMGIQKIPNSGIQKTQKIPNSWPPPPEPLCRRSLYGGPWQPAATTGALGAQWEPWGVWGQSSPDYGEMQGGAPTPPRPLRECAKRSLHLSASAFLAGAHGHGGDWLEGLRTR